MAASVPLGGETQSIALCETLDVTPVKELHADVGIEALHFAQLAVLTCYEGLLHDGDLDEEVLFRQIEVGRERTHDPAFLVPLENERVGLIVPRDAVVIEDLCALNLDTVGEPRGLGSTICLENGAFVPHLHQRTDGFGRRPIRRRLLAVFRIAQISDLHCGETYFEASLLERAIGEINELRPDVVVCSGDLTTFGFRHEYLTAREYLDRIDCDALVVVPGNHDSRNVGYVHFEEMFGERNSVLRKSPVAIVAVDSSEPDLDHGQIGRGRYRWIEEEFLAEPAQMKVFVLHHHLLPVPGTGRERNVVYDAGDAIECLQRAGVRLVLSGHKHVPYVWRLEDLFVVNAGTVSSLRLRGNTRPCYNVIEIDGTRVDIWRRHPFHGKVKLVSFALDTLEYAKFTGAIEDEVTTRT
jgi:3',5'-cyclic-AMP phosphodiesterase